MGEIRITDPNYCATIVKIEHLDIIPNMDNCLHTNFYGVKVLVGKNTKIGDVGVFFTPETEISSKLLHENNLYDNKSLNKDQNVKGYIRENGRVRAIKLRGNDSHGLFLPIAALAYLKTNFDLGQTFNYVGDNLVCKKHIPVRHTNNASAKLKKKGARKPFSRVIPETFPEHIKTVHFLRCLPFFNSEDQIVVTEKLHGTSARFAHTVVKRQLSFLERTLKSISFGYLKFKQQEFALLCGSRTVVKNDRTTGYYSNNVWLEVFDEIKHLIPKNFIIYGEIIGWDGDKKIQKAYSYRLPTRTKKFLVYRMTTINEDGFELDLPWDYIKTFCVEHGLNHVPEIFVGKMKDFDHSIYENKDFVKDLGLTQCYPLDDEAPCSEGVVIRKEGFRPLFTKFKSPNFVEMETKNTDDGVISVEDVESVVDE